MPKYSMGDIVDVCMRGKVVEMKLNTKGLWPDAREVIVYTVEGEDGTRVYTVAEDCLNKIFGEDKQEPKTGE